MKNAAKRGNASPEKAVAKSIWEMSSRVSARCVRDKWKVSVAEAGLENGGGRRAGESRVGNPLTHMRPLDTVERVPCRADLGLRGFGVDWREAKKEGKGSA